MIKVKHISSQFIDNHFKVCMVGALVGLIMFIILAIVQKQTLFQIMYSVIAIILAWLTNKMLNILV